MRAVRLRRSRRHRFRSTSIRSDSIADRRLAGSRNRDGLADNRCSKCRGSVDHDVPAAIDIDSSAAGGRSGYVSLGWRARRHKLRSERHPQPRQCGQGANQLLQFDFSALPAGKPVTATLELYLEGGKDLMNGAVDLHVMTRSWTEGTNDDEVPTFSPGATYREYAAWSFGTACGRIRAVTSTRRNI